MLIFSVRRLLSLKNCQMRSQNSFLWFSLKIRFFSKKLLNKKIFNIKFLIKKFIFILGVSWPLTGRTVTQLDVLPSPLQPLLLHSEISLFWRTSCARGFSIPVGLCITIQQHYSRRKWCEGGRKEPGYYKELGSLHLRCNPQNMTSLVCHCTESTHTQRAFQSCILFPWILISLVPLSVPLAWWNFLNFEF